MALWYPEAIRDESKLSRLAFTGGPRKGVLHTTEGKTYAGARGAYVANKSWPHFTCSQEGGRFRVWQHEPVDEASRSLRNLAGGVQTNTDGVIQIEMVGTCNTANRSSWGTHYVENWPVFYKDGIARLMRWVEVNAGVARRVGVKFKSYPASYGSGNGVRLSNQMFDVYSGWLGHQHVPENLHGDPGLIDVTYLLTHGVVVTPPPPATTAPASVVHFPEDDMTRNEFPYSSDANGDAWLHTSLPYGKVMSIIPWTAHVEHDVPTNTYKACGVANMQDRGGTAYIVIRGGMANLSGVPLVVWTVT